MQRRTITPIFLVDLVLLAGCLSAPLQTTADGDAGGINATNATTVSTTDTGEATVGTGLVVVFIVVTTIVDSADKARDTVTDDVAAVHATFADTGIAEGVVQTTGFNIYPEYDYSGQERELLDYCTAHTLHVEVVLDRVGEIIDLTVGASASEIHGVAFTPINEKRVELREKALAHAVDSAKADADLVASAASLTVVDVHTTTVGSGASPGPYPVAYAEDAAHASSGSIELSPGPVTVPATVQMVYEAESE